MEYLGHRLRLWTDWFWSICWWKLASNQWNRHTLSMPMGRNTEPLSPKQLHFIIDVEFLLFALFSCYGWQFREIDWILFCLTALQQLRDSAIFSFVHMQQKSPKIASSVCFDSARHHIIQNMITHSCLVAAKCIPNPPAKTIILLNRKDIIVHSPV